MTYSTCLRLLRAGCNVAELAEWFRMPEMQMRGHVRRIERRVRRILRGRAAFRRPERAA